MSNVSTDTPWKVTIAGPAIAWVRHALQRDTTERTHDLGHFTKGNFSCQLCQAYRVMC